jgi:hypothetical protein
MKLIVLSACLMAVMSGCLHIEPPHEGVVRDAETGKPIKDVVVHIDLETVFLVPAAHVNTKWKDGFEVLSDETGKYKLPLKVIRQGLLEISSGKEMSFIKSGYFPARVLTPAMYNDVHLYRIKYYLDYLYYKKLAEEGGWGGPHYYVDKKPEAFSEYKREISKITYLPVVRIANDVNSFLEVPDTILTELHCETNFSPTGLMTSVAEKSPETFGIRGNVCRVFDERSRQWLFFDSQGNIQKPIGGVSAQRGANLNARSTANLPETSDNLSNVDLTKLKGKNVLALTIENHGRHLCYVVGEERGCISMDDFLSQNGRQIDRNAIFTLVTQEVSSTAYFIFIIKSDDHYQIYRWSCDGITPLSPVLLTREEITTLETDGNDFFIVFEQSGVKKYSLKFGQSPLTENQAFRANMRGFSPGKIYSSRLGRSVSERTLYITNGTSQVYRMSLDGILDYRVGISE